MRFFADTVAQRGRSTTLPILKKSAFEEILVPVPRWNCRRSLRNWSRGTSGCGRCSGNPCGRQSIFSNRSCTRRSRLPKMKIAMSANAANSQECVYCGATGCLTRDHVPPKAIFSKPLPSNLITVPACAKCNSAASNDDEYFRLSLQVRDQMESHPDVIRSRPVLLRSLEKPQKAGMRNALIKNIFLADLVTRVEYLSKSNGPSKPIRTD